MSATKVDSSIVVDKLHDGDDAFTRAYGSSEMQLETALMPGRRDVSTQCLIKRNKKTSTFYLYFALTPSFTDDGKFMLAAKRFMTSAYTEYIISLDAGDFSQGSKAYVGKIRSNFLRTNFIVYDSQPLLNGAKPTNGKVCRIFASKQISPQVPSGNFELREVTYKSNLFKSRGPRRMVSTLRCPSSSSANKDDGLGFTILKNKPPKWHGNIQGWGLNFGGRVKVSSVKNFQLIATTDPSQPTGKDDKETVFLQFGKVGDDTFTMDYRHPLSAFQAFAISLTSFGTKFACQGLCKM